MKNRIHSKKDLNTYLICDEIAFTGHKLSTIRRILLCLARHQNLGLWFLKKNRRLEYRFNNRNKSPFHKLVYFLAGYRYVRWQHQYSCSIPVNVIGPGFRIWHFAQGSIIINDQAIIGTGCSISAGCCIGQAKEHAPIIGDACEICLKCYGSWWHTCRRSNGYRSKRTGTEEFRGIRGHYSRFSRIGDFASLRGI